ncbi:unnamed protein product, partial [Didymodactylos carnosus]
CSSFIAGDVVNDEQRSVMTDTLTTVTNSIDLPSKSSSLTANDQLLSMQRSKSLQFVRTSTISSTDSGTLSNNSSDFDSKKNNTVKCRATVLSRSDDLSPRHLSFSTCKEPSLQSTRGENSSDDIEIHSVIEMQTENETLLTQKSQTKLSASCDAILTKIEHETTEIVEPIKQRYPAMNGNHIQNGTEQGENLNRSLSLTPAVTRKMTKIPAKKGLVSKVGKSFSTLKSNVVKALHPQQQQQQSLSNKQPISTDNSHQNGVNHQEESELKSNSTSFPQETISKRRREDEINLHHSPFNEFLPMNNNTTDSINIPETSSPIDPTDTIAKLKHEIDTLNNRLIKNELLIEHLTTASQNERLTFTHERLQLTKTIEDLTADNKRLRQQIKEGDQYISDKYSRRRSLKYSQNACLNDISRSLSKIDKRISNVNEQQQSLISTSLTTPDSMLLSFYLFLDNLMSSSTDSQPKEPPSPTFDHSTFATPAANSTTTFDLPSAPDSSNDEQLRIETTRNNDDLSQYTTPTSPLSPQQTSSPKQHQSQSTPPATTSQASTSTTVTSAETASVEQQPQTTSIVDEMKSLLISEDLRFPLEDTWSFWFFKNDRNAEWKDNLIKVTTVSTVESFWSVYNHMQVASRLGQGCDYMFFKTNIQPMWEDINNRNGGRWVLNLNKNQRGPELDTFWLFTMLSLIGDQYADTADHVNGAVVSIRSKGDRISLWTRDWRDTSVTKNIGRRFREVADIPKQYQVFFESHEDQETKRGANSKILFKA